MTDRDAIARFNVPGVLIGYENHRGERGNRRILPMAIYHDRANKYHGSAWILRAWDHDKDEMREFAMKNIYSWAEWLV